MKGITPLYLTCAALSLCATARAQTDGKLREAIEATGYVHAPLPLDYSKSFETFARDKEVTDSRLLCDMESLDGWSHRGIGSIRLNDTRRREGSRSLRIVAPTTVDQFLGWGLGFGTSLASFDVGGENWERYNRVKLYVYPDCEGARSIYLNLYVENDGKVKVPDKYGREGYHEMNLINRQWNECTVEMTELPRDRVSKLSFAIEVFGRERTMGDSLKFDIDQVELQTVARPEVVSGWQPAEGRVIFSTSGYRAHSRKSAIAKVPGNDGTFQLVDADTRQPVYSGRLRKQETYTGHFEVADFTDFRTLGQYRLRVNDVTTMPFGISDDIWDNSAWRVLNFMFVERCGYPVPDKHGVCHTDLNGTYDGKQFAVNGGWHDAADMSQQTLQTGEIAMGLLEMSVRAKAKGNRQLQLRLREEAEWGIDYILKTRLGDGYRVQTWGTNLWTDGFIGTKDDTGRRQARVHNRAFENFVFAGIEAYAAMNIEHDSVLAGFLRKAAKEDFAFALARYDKTGFDELTSGGGGGDHAAMAPRSQYMANISWAASMLYKLTGEQAYADKAAEAIRYTLRCQRVEPLGDRDQTRGFFYRDLERKSITHYNHQSRDHYYMWALTLLCQTQPTHPEYAKWADAIRLYGDYLKGIMKYVAPYGMVPSGVYHVDEVNDSVNFYIAQVGIRSGAANDYREQLRNGVRLDKEHYLRRFPVWFSFKGNAAVQLATGKAAALCAKFLRDDELTDIAEQQLFWIVGKNPFGQSLIWGEGSNYPQLYTALPGETVGAIPVGMQSRFNEDSPYWPQFNTATYKEVWGVPAGKWLSLIAEF
ncbi:MAG: glycoside hydrolase family 9 protein [Mediterranea sp.]|jgi:hypothetical protein|nr:glycoside hydrolase family 9 protein [Mediterranea sp.]